MPKKKVDPPSTPPASTHAGLLQKSAAVGTSVKWSSPGELSMKRQPNLFGSGSLVVLNENGMIGEEVLLDGEDLYHEGVPSGMEERYYRYRIDSFEEGKRNTFHLTYLEQCIKYDGNEWISLPDDSLVLEDFPKSHVLAGHVKMREKTAAIREYHRQKDNVLKATLAAQGSEPSIAKDVDVRDIIQAANADRGKGWSSYRVLEVSHV